MSLLNKIAGLFGKGEQAPEDTPGDADASMEESSAMSVEAASEVSDENEEDPSTADTTPAITATTLHECAATPGTARLCHDLLENGADPLKRDADGRSALHIAAIHGNIDVLKELKEHVISIDPYDNLRLSPLVCAIRARQDEAAQLLLSQGATLTLNVAFALGDLLLINRLFSEDKDALKNCKAPEELLTDYVTAIRRKCDEKIARAGAKDSVAIEAIEDEVIEPYLPILPKIFDMGYHPDVFDSAGRPALFQAVQFTSTILAEVLLKHDANADFESDDGQTPLSIASANRPKMQALLREHGAEEDPSHHAHAEAPAPTEDEEEQIESGPGVAVPTIKTNHPSPSELKARRKK